MYPAPVSPTVTEYHFPTATGVWRKRRKHKLHCSNLPNHIKTTSKCLWSDLRPSKLVKKKLSSKYAIAVTSHSCLGHIHITLQVAAGFLHLLGHIPGAHPGKHWPETEATEEKGNMMGSNSSAETLLQAAFCVIFQQREILPSHTFCSIFFH